MSEPTLEQMRDDVINFCERQYDCTHCILNLHPSCAEYSQLTAPEEVIRDAYNKINPPEPVKEVEEEPTITHDIVNHPEHYCREGAMECIDEMILVFGVKNTIRFCLMNSHKYRYRSANKNGEEDIKKSDWYYAKAKELMECHDIKSWWD